MDYYSRDSVKIYFAENIIARSFVQILLLHRQLKSLNENGEKLYNLNLNYLESLSIDDIKSFDDINLEQFKKNFSLCRNYFNNEWGGPFFAGADSLDLLIDLFNALGEEKIKDFIIFMALNNDLVCTGWPDLVVFEKGNYYFIEVKTTDKLHISQIITINKIIKDLGIKVKCIKIKKT